MAKKRKATKKSVKKRSTRFYPSPTQGIKLPLTKEEESLAMDMGEVEEDIYDEVGQEHLLEDDEIEAWEQGYLKGFEGKGYGKKERGGVEEVSATTYFEETRQGHATQKKGRKHSLKATSKKKKTAKKKVTKKTKKKVTKKKQVKKKTTKKKAATKKTAKKKTATKKKSTKKKKR